MKAILAILSSSKSLVVVSALAIVGLLNFISSFRVPASRIDFIFFAASVLWIEILVVSSLVAIIVLRNGLATFSRSTIGFLVRGDKRTKGLAFRVAACAVGVVLIYTQSQVMEMRHDARKIVEARRAVYDEVFGDGYIRTLEAEALGLLSVGRAETAQRRLSLAEKWELASVGARTSIGRVREGVAYRVLLSQDLARLGTQSKLATDYVSTSYLLAAYAMNRDGYRTKERLMRRYQDAVAFENAFFPMLVICGTGSASSVGAKLNGACVQLGAQHLDVHTSDCRSTARMICEAHGVKGMEPELAAWILRSNTASPTLHQVLRESQDSLSDT